MAVCFVAVEGEEERREVGCFGFEESVFTERRLGFWDWDLRWVVLTAVDGRLEVARSSRDGGGRRSKMCIVPLSLVQASHLPPSLKARPRMMAFSTPRRNSAIWSSVLGSKTRTKVPCSDDVASRVPDGERARQRRAVLCALRTRLEPDGRGMSATWPIDCAGTTSTSSRRQLRAYGFVAVW